MTRRLLALGAILFAFSTSPVRADPVYVQNVAWEKLPTGESFAEAYPPEALASELNGSATLDCLIEDGGALTCLILAEEPMGAGFGDAALAVASEFRAAALSKDGVSVFGKRVRLPISFKLEEPSEDETADDAADVARPSRTETRTLPPGADLYWETGMITRFYPRAARDAGIEGRVALNCVINERLRYDCTVVSESPAGHGFADAAMRIMREFYLRLAPGEASPVGRRRTEYIHFRKER